MEIPGYPNHLTMIYGKPGLIPCNTGFPGATVELYEESFPKKKITEQDGAVFDPHEGFVIQNVTSAFDGLFKCNVSVGNVTYNMTFTLLINSKFILHTLYFVFVNSDAVVMR